MPDPRSLPPGFGVETDVTATEFLHLHDYWRIVMRRRWLIVAFVVVGVAAAVVYNQRALTIFEARATLQIETDANVLALDRPLTDRWDWMREFLPTQLGILSSRDIARMAHDQLAGPASTPADPSTPVGPSMPVDASTPVGPSMPVDPSPPVPSIDQILAGRSVDAIKDTRLVTVSYRSTDPNEAARVANALATAYVERSSNYARRATGDASEWLAQQVEEQRRVLQAGEEALQRYREKNGADSLMADRLGAEQQNIVVQKLGELQGAVSKARADTIDKEAQYRQLLAIQESNGDVDALPAIGSNTYIQGLKGEVLNLQRQFAQTSQELGDRHPDLLKLRAALAESQQKLQREIDRAVQSIRNDFEAAQARERGLNQALDRQKAAVQALNSKTVQYTSLEREAETNREVLGKLMQRSREASLARSLQTTNVAIVDKAEIPRRPVLPRKARNMLIGLVAGAALAFGTVFGLEIFNTRLRSPEEVERHLHVSVLGVVPAVKLKEARRPLLLQSVETPQYAEQIHSLRTSVMMSPMFATSRVLLVTSAEPGEGKTQTAASLAMSIARLNQRVLLIDADLRKPSLHTLFNTDLSPGLGEMLTAAGTSSAFRKTKMPRLWVMPSGSVKLAPADLLGSEVFETLLELSQQRFDWVIIDSPPVMAVADPCLIARLASGVVFVVGSGQTRRDVSNAALQRLETAGAKIVGTVLNRADLHDRGFSYLPYYHRDYETHYPRLEASLTLSPDALQSADILPDRRHG
jgi:capsular exopolysaccharide synthesis family protein